MPIKKDVQTIYTKTIPAFRLEKTGHRKVSVDEEEDEEEEEEEEQEDEEEDEEDEYDYERKERSVSAKFSVLPDEYYDSNKYELSPLQSVAAAVVLEEAADELAILGKMGDLPRNIEANLTYKTLDQRFGQFVRTGTLFDPETIEPYEIAMHKQKFIKFQEDRSFVEQVLRETVRELTSKHNFRSLVKHLSHYDKKLQEENRLLELEARNEAKLNELHSLLHTERKEALGHIQKFSELIGKLKDEYEDKIFENKIKSHYIESWEDSRVEQNNYRLDKHEEYYVEIINKVKGDIEREIRIDAEIESYIGQCIRDYEDQIQYWMDTYEREIEIRDTEIQVLKEKREDQFNRIQKLSQLYNKHKREIRDYLKLKEQRRQERELKMKREKAATRLQRWWRRIMMRRGLGKYRKAGKKDKKKGKK